MLLCISWMMLLLLFSGCQKEMVIPAVPTDPELFYYEGTKGMGGTKGTIAVDEEGKLYTVKFENTSTQTSAIVSSIGDVQWEEDTQHFLVYDLDGTCLLEQDILMGNGIIRSMVIEDTTLYCLTSTMTDRNVLYAVDNTTWEKRKIAELGEEDYSSINKMVLVEDYMYLFGNTAGLSETLGYFSPEGISIDDNNLIGRVSIMEENPQIEFLNVELPQDIFKTQDNTLMIYYYNEENGFGFLEFSPQEEVFKEAGWKTGVSELSEFCQCEDGYLFIQKQNLHYGTIDGAEAQITIDSPFLNGYSTISFVYGNEMVFYYDTNKKLVGRMKITDTMKENKEIRFLMQYGETNKPNGFGYRMKNEFLEVDAYALKVLAQDADFDMFLLYSNSSIAYNLKEKGAFYPLDKVPGVKEYINACFPALKEAATNKDGDIWMIPIQFTVPVLQYPKEHCAKKGVDYSTMDFMDFLVLIENIAVNEPSKGGMSHYVMISQLFQQYLKEYTTFDTDVFRSYAKQIRSIYEQVGELHFGRGGFRGFNEYDIRDGKIANIYFDYDINITRQPSFVKAVGDSDKIGVVGVPSISEQSKNIGTVQFLAVNSNSDNLEATLNYVSELCSYMMTQKDSYLLADSSTYTDTPFVNGHYQVYADSSVYFAMDSEIYWTPFWDYVEGKMELEDMIKEIERKFQMYKGE